MCIKAEMGHWSSVVGGGVHLIGPKGNMIGQVAFLCHDDAPDSAADAILALRDKRVIAGGRDE